MGGWAQGPQADTTCCVNHFLREKIVLEITMGYCKMNYGTDKKDKKEKRQIKKK